MAQGLTDWLQQNRLTVVSVDKGRGTVRVRADGDACSDLACGDSLLVAGEGPAGLDALHPGDIIRVDRQPGRPDRIVVVRRVWDELTSPEL